MRPSLHHWLVSFIWIALGSGCVAADAAQGNAIDSGPSKASYTLEGQCDRLPRLKHLQTPAGVCVGMVATGFRFARGIAQLANDDLVVADMGGWAKDRGGVWLLRRMQDGTFAKTKINAGIDKPNGIAVGPDGLVYVGTPDAIYRFDPYAATLKADPTQKIAKRGAFAGVDAYKQPPIQLVIKGLPSAGRHPLKKFVFDLHEPWTLYVNLGSVTDVCEQGADARPPDGFPFPCTEAEGTGARGVLRRYVLSGPDHLGGAFTTLAHGLRNSMALALHPQSNLLLQAENSRDAIDTFDAALKSTEGELPHEEINIIAAGAHYGWPYCMDQGVAVPEYRGRVDCAQYRPPALLLPAHAAPLGMAFYTGTLFPAAYRDQLIVAYHGYREHGHRLVMVPVDARGAPTGAAPLDIIRGWNKRSDSRDPQGAPVDVIVAHDGSLYLTEDKNGAVLRVFYDAKAGAGAPLPVLAPTAAVVDADEATRCADLAKRTDRFARIQREVIDNACVSCHGVAGGNAGNLALRRCDAVGNAQRLTTARSDGREAYAVAGNIDSELLLRLQGKGFPQMPAGGLGAAQLRLVQDWVRTGAVAPK